MFALEQQKLKVSDERSSEKCFVVEMWKRDLICKITLIFCGCNDIVLEFKVGDRSHMVFNAIVSELFVTMVQWGCSSFLVWESIWIAGEVGTIFSRTLFAYRCHNLPEKECAHATNNGHPVKHTMLVFLHRVLQEEASCFYIGDKNLPKNPVEVWKNRAWSSSRCGLHLRCRHCMLQEATTQIVLPVLPRTFFRVPLWENETFVLLHVSFLIFSPYPKNAVIY